MKISFLVLCCFISLSLYAKSSKSYGVNWSVSIDEDSQEVISTIHNTDSHRNYTCSYSFNIGLNDQFDREVARQMVTYKGIFFHHSTSYTLKIKKSDLNPSPNLVLSEFKNKITNLSCKPAASTVSVFTQALETSLSNNHLNYAKELYDSFGQKNKIKVLELLGAYTSLNPEELDYFSLNHVEYFKGKVNKSDCSLKKSKVCGYKYFQQRSSVCGVERYRIMASAACGVLRYKQCHTSGCGRKLDGSRKRCRHERCGVELYHSCRSYTHGPELYRSCRHHSFGKEDVNTCKVKITSKSEAKKC